MLVCIKLNIFWIFFPVLSKAPWFIYFILFYLFIYLFYFILFFSLSLSLHDREQSWAWGSADWEASFRGSR